LAGSPGHWVPGTRIHWAFPHHPLPGTGWMNPRRVGLAPSPLVPPPMSPMSPGARFGQLRPKRPDTATDSRVHHQPPTAASTTTSSGSDFPPSPVPQDQVRVGCDRACARVGVGGGGWGWVGVGSGGWGWDGLGGGSGPLLFPPHPPPPVRFRTQWPDSPIDGQLHPAGTRGKVWDEMSTHSSTPNGHGGAGGGRQQGGAASQQVGSTYRASNGHALVPMPTGSRPGTQGGTPGRLPRELQPKDKSVGVKPSAMAAAQLYAYGRGAPGSTTSVGTTGATVASSVPPPIHGRTVAIHS
jgi:hypothetical protein